MARNKQKTEIDMTAFANRAYGSFFAISFNFAILGVASLAACNCGQNLFADFILG